MFFCNLFLNRQSFLLELLHNRPYTPQWVGSLKLLHSPESDLVKHQSTCKSPWKKKSLTLCQAVERRLVWRLYEFFFPQFRTFYFTAPNVTTYCFFSLASFIFIHVEMKFSPVRQENCRVALQGPQLRGTLHFGVGCPLALLSEGWRSWSRRFFPAQELNPAVGPVWARSKGPWLLPRVEREKMSQGGKRRRNRYKGHY